jgi:hypothetical protein
LSGLGLALNVVLLAGLVFGVWAWWRWRDVSRTRRFRLAPVVSAPGPWVRATRWTFEGLVFLELALAIGHLGNVRSFAEALSGEPTNRLLVALDLALFVFLFRSDVLAGGAFLCEDVVRKGWGASARYADVESIEWIGDDLLVLRTPSDRMVLRVDARERESVARFLGEKTGKLVSAPATRA